MNEAIAAAIKALADTVADRLTGTATTIDLARINDERTQLARHMLKAYLGIDHDGADFATLVSLLIQRCQTAQLNAKDYAR